MKQIECRRSIQVTHDFLTRCFARDEFIALLLRRQKPVSVTQRIVLLERALAPRYLGWIAHQNAAGSNIYVAANPVRAGTRKRTNFETQECTLKLLAFVFGGDPACTDCNRVLRVPGFLNLKYDPAHLVTVQYSDGSPSKPEDFRLGVEVRKAMDSQPHNVARAHSARQSNSEFDWAWVLRELTGGEDALRLTRELASRRSDKPSPLYYAQRTVDVASARVWLMEGCAA
jgi:hypothetical protein